MSPGPPVAEVAFAPSLRPADTDILTPGAIDFVAELARKFGDRVAGLLAQRQEVQSRLSSGQRLDFLAETRAVREGDWKVAPLPPDLLDRRVEITGPTDRKMVINALNSGASVYMADFEDATSPTWHNLVDGQRNLRAAIRRMLVHKDETSGKRYQLNDQVAVLMVRPRGWHLPEKHFLVDGRPVPGALFDFGLYLFHNAQELRSRGSGPYFYLPKMEHHLEARLWNDVFLFSQERLGLPRGTIKATCLIETLPAAFQMDEILFELREHSAGLNCGRWDYIFSFIKKLRDDPASVLPDRGQVTMTQPFMRAYTRLLIKTCHRRGVHAMGGMAAQIPIKNDPRANEEALARVRADKLREVRDGHDGTWIAHPGLLPVAREVFDAHMPGKNQLDVIPDVQVGADDLLRPPEGTRTEEGLRLNVRVGVQYLEAWLLGLGCVPLYHLMEDAATAEISRSQIWQWQHHKVPLADGKPVTAARLEEVLSQEMERVRGEVGEERYARGRYQAAGALFLRLSTAPELADFLTLPAYEVLLREEAHDDFRR
jgi:malate synthase